MNVAGPFNTGPAVGSGGSATINIDTPVLIGTIIAVGLQINLADPVYGTGSLDLTIATKGLYPAPLPQSILTLTAASADGWFNPRPPIHALTGGAIANQYDVGIPIYDQVNLLVENADPDDTVDVWFLME